MWLEGKERNIPHDAGEDDEDGILDARGDHGDVTGETGHAGDVGQVVDDDVGAGELLIRSVRFN
jgi:hypothetical protein